MVSQHPTKGLDSAKATRDRNALYATSLSDWANDDAHNKREEWSGTAMNSESSSIRTTSATAPSVYSYSSPASSIDDKISLANSASSSTKVRKWALFRKGKATLPKIMVEPLEATQDAPKKSGGFFKHLHKNNKSTSDLREHVLSREDLGKVDARFAPIPHLRAMPPSAAPTRELPNSPRPQAPPPTPLTPFASAHLHGSSTEGELYFAVDPDWDPSQGEATLYSIPSPTYSCVDSVDILGYGQESATAAPRRRSRSYASFSQFKRQNREGSFLDFD